jgi:hypothetical protein
MSRTGDDCGYFLRSMAAPSGLAGKSAIRFAADGALREEPEAAVPDLHAYGERSHFVESERTGSLLWPMRTAKPRDYGFRTPLQDSVGTGTPLFGSVRPEWRTNSSRTRFSTAIDSAQLPRHQQREMAAANLVGRSALYGQHGKYEIPKPAAGWEVSLV